MTLTDSTRSMLAWLRTTPTDAPDALDASCPLLVLERTRLSEDETGHVADLVRRFDPVTALDVGVEITRVLDALPHPEDVAQVLALVSARP
ncbi:uncharacterized protein DUF3349 [Salana multivorans]|uniref:Uncharacterized protein DUF3349 n=1 Tax=Salana multivorans TaxID=120377 RepID=A0A3N2D942_9MICO|nr:DUF3349 domain-containing protein [Salana multivorans]MBN8883869.1 DUF3349 domain-containing protein [Salana multivorans]OJX97369.1 MAG: hypothetical protein BGO96_05420 [Micrococcales bacterium 73-15]ROR96290.1 uncharacterized protein DUF3349 [Salana multivorans]